jgi:uncharacterized protein YycO
MLLRLRYYLLRALYPFMRFSAHLGKPEPKVTYEFYLEVASKIEVGDVLLSREDYKFTNLMIPGFWSHAAIYAGDGWVMEAVGDGVHKVSLVEWILDKDHVAVKRFKTPKEKRELAGKLALSHDGEPYDYQMGADNQAWYCAELAYGMHDAVTDGLPFEVKTTWGVMTVTPEDFWISMTLDLISLFGGPNS